MTLHLTTCSLCEASCGLVIDVDGGAVKKIRGDADDPLSRGHICPKAVALQDIHTDPDRLRVPLVRDGNRHREVGWDEAFDLVGRRLEEVRAAHGADARALFIGNPTIHNVSAMIFTPLFAAMLGTRNRYSAASIDQLPQMVAAHAMFGHQLLVPVPDIDRTDFMLVFGANPAASNGSLMTAPGVTDRLDAIRARGGKVVLVDPRRTESMRHADQHHFIRPGTDALVMLAMLETLFVEKLGRPGRLAAMCDDLAELEALARRFPAERVAARTGMAATAIRQLARDFAAAPRAVVYGRMGISTQAFGTLASWALNGLNVVTGRVDAEGGAMFPAPAIDGLKLSKAYGPGSYDRYRSRVRGLPEFSGEFPVATLVDEIETPGPGQVKALVTMAGNPVLSTPNGRRLERALASLDFMVSIDFYLNATTRHAHVILPPASPLERDHYDLALFHFSVRNFAKFSPAVFERPPEARHDWEILAALSERLAGKNLLKRTAVRLTKKLGPRRILDVALRTGPHGVRPFGRTGLSLKALAEQPHGVDLGPLEPALPGRLRTKSGRVKLVPAFVAQDLGRLEADLELGNAAPDVALDLEMIGRRHLRSNNSWLHNSQRLVKGQNRCTVLMHPSDAAARGLGDGQSVVVASPRGEIVLPLETTDDIMPGVVSVPHGFDGADRSADPHAGDAGALPPMRLRVQLAHAGASTNDVTDERRVDALSGNAAFNGTRVRVRAAAPS
ncbi:MAG: molybdopterin-dependent oxidoreductase [Myxococcota bacterium]